MAPPPPELMEELVEEILLRLPPGDPASLVRAALVCRLWRRLASAPAFRRRFREFHRMAPVLGVLCERQDDSINDDEDRLPTACFIPTSSFRPARAGHYGCEVVDARHGRVLLRRYPDQSSRNPWWINLIVWDPITDEQQELPSLPPSDCYNQWNATVMCAAAGRGGCDHLDCHRGGSFLVLVVCMGSERMSTMIYASEANVWSEAASANPHSLHNFFESSGSRVLLGNTLYILTRRTEDIVGILKYDMITQEISTMDLTCKFSENIVLQNIVLMTTDDGRLGLATMDDMADCKLIQLWSREDGGGSDRFVHSRVIDLEKLLPASAFDEASSIRVNSFADDARVLFVGKLHTFADDPTVRVVPMFHGLYSIDIKSEQVKEVPYCYAYRHVVPYASFHTTALGAGSAGGPPRSGSSNP